MTITVQIPKQRNVEIQVPSFYKDRGSDVFYAILEDETVVRYDLTPSQKIKSIIRKATAKQHVEFLHLVASQFRISRYHFFKSLEEYKRIEKSVDEKLNPVV